MRSQWAALATFVVMILATPLAPPTTGWLYDDEVSLFVFPLTVTQCQPFDIFYNLTNGFDFIGFYDITNSIFLFRIDPVPDGTGYLEWICNIPAGFGFIVDGIFGYTVKAGSSSACLGNITTTYSDLSYDTTAFPSYTRNTSRLVTPLPTNTLPTTAFPTGTFSTITLNPNLAVTPTSSTSSPPSSTLSSPSSSSPLSSPTTPPSPKPHSASIAGGVVGAVTFVLLILTLVLWRRRRHLVLARASSPIDHQPSSISGLATGQLGSTDLSPPFRCSGAEFLGGTQQHPFSPLDLYKTEPTSFNPIDVPVTGNLAAHVDPIVGQRSSQGAIIPLEADSALPSQRPRETPDSGRQASFPTSVPDSASLADSQPPSTQYSDVPASTAPEISLLNPTSQLQLHSTTETQEMTLDFASVVGVISRAQLSPHERQVITSVNNLLIQASPASLNLAGQNTTVTLPPAYTE